MTAILRRQAMARQQARSGPLPLDGEARHAPRSDKRRRDGRLSRRGMATDCDSGPGFSRGFKPFLWGQGVAILVLSFLIIAS